MKELVQTNKEFWGNYVPNAWEHLPIDHKLSWIVFGFHTVSLLTIMELFLLKR
jgi:hypothetical protein